VSRLGECAWLMVPGRRIHGLTHLPGSSTQAGAVPGSVGLAAEIPEKLWLGCRIDGSAFVEKVSGSRPGCP